MRKLFVFLIATSLTLGLFFNISFATDDIIDEHILSTEEFKETDPIPDNSGTSHKNITTESLSKEEIIDIILNDAEFNSYLSDELENIYNSLVEFVLQKPEILKHFEDSLNITEPSEIRNFFEELITSKDVKDCLISLLDEPDFYNVFKNGNLDTLIDAFYETLTIWDRKFPISYC